MDAIKLHMTLCFLSENQLSPERQTALKTIVSAWAEETNAFGGIVDKFERWTSDYGIAHVARIEVPLWVFDAQKELAKTIKAAGLPLSTRYKWNPHVTFALTTDDVPAPKMAYDRSIFFGNVFVDNGERWESYPLQ